MSAGMRAVGIVAAVCIAAVVACVADDWLFPEEERRPSRAEAEDLVRKGRIPECVSENASDFFVRFSVDTGELWGAFRFSESAFDCQVITNPVLRALPRPAGTEWWPRDPFPPPSATIIEIPADRAFYAVIDSGEGRAYFWKPGTLSRPIRKAP